MYRWGVRRVSVLFCALLVAGGLVAQAAGDIEGYAQRISSLVDPAKLATLGARGANPRVEKYVVILAEYIELVRHLTNQTARRTMKQEIKQLIVNNPDYIEAIDASWQSWTELKSEAEQNFRGVIEEKLADQVKPIPVNRELSIEVQSAEDGDGFYIPTIFGLPGRPAKRESKYS